MYDLEASIICDRIISGLLILHFILLLLLLTLVTPSRNITVVVMVFTLQQIQLRIVKVPSDTLRTAIQGPMNMLRSR